MTRESHSRSVTSGGGGDNDGTGSKRPVPRPNDPIKATAMTGKSGATNRDRLRANGGGGGN